MATYVSKEILDITQDEDALHTANFTDYMRGDTIASVVSIDETTSLGLTLGSGTVNAAAVEVDDRTIAIGKCVQFMIDATPATSTGAAVVRVIVLTTGGDRKSLDCRLNVVE